MRVAETKEGSIIGISVKSKSRKSGIAVEKREIFVFSTEETAESKANRELIKEPARFFRRRVELVSGSTSRNKRLLIRSISKREVKDILTLIIDH